MGQAWKARLDNQSPFTLKVTADQGSTYLAPFSSVLVCGGGGPASVNVAVQAQTAAPVSGVTPQLFATWAVSPDDVPAVGAAGGSPTAPFYRFRDELYWPCISGEQLPPTLAGSGAYDSLLGRPSVSVSSNTGGSATWPQLPRVSSAGAALLTISFIKGVTNLNAWQAAEVGRFIYNTTQASGPALLFDATVTTYKLTMYPGGVSFDTGIAPSLTAWDAISIGLSDVAVTVSVNGVQAISEATKLWKSTDSPSDIRAKFQASGGFQTHHLSQLRYAYS